MKIVMSVGALALCSGAAFGQLGIVDFDGDETGLVGYSNPIVSYAGPGFGTSALDVSAFGSTTWTGGDSMWPMTRAAVGPNAIGMPFGISDDSVAAAAGNSVFATDALGFAGQAKTDGFFGICDTVNGLNTGPIVVDFVFGGNFLDPEICIDFAAMGDFEAADVMDFTYSFDGSNFFPLFTSSVDESGNTNYVMDSGSAVALDDPFYINGTLLNDNFQTLAATAIGAGPTLTLRLTAISDGGEGLGFDNIKVVPTPGALALMGIAGVATIRRRRA